VPSVVEARKQSEQANDGRFPAEPYQIVSQYALEPLLKSVAENVRGRDRAVWLRTPSFEEHEDKVVVRVRDLDGREGSITGRYLVGCDGGSSTVRTGLGFRLEGQSTWVSRCRPSFIVKSCSTGLATGKGAHLLPRRTISGRS